MNRKLKRQIRLGIGIFLIIFAIIFLVIAGINLIQYFMLNSNAENVTGEFLFDISNILLVITIGSNALSNAIYFGVIGIILLIIGLIVKPK